MSTALSCSICFWALSISTNRSSRCFADHQETHTHAHTLAILICLFPLYRLISCQPLRHASLTSLKSLIKAYNSASRPPPMHYLNPKTRPQQTHAHKNAFRCGVFSHANANYICLLLDVHIQTHMNTFARACRPHLHAHTRAQAQKKKNGTQPRWWCKTYVFWWYESWPHLHANRSSRLMGLWGGGGPRMGVKEDCTVICCYGS